MAGNYTTTARNALRALLGTSKVADIDEGFLNLANDVDQKMLSFWEDTFAKRPAAGQPNRLFRASDTGAIYHDTGTVWERLARVEMGIATLTWGTGSNASNVNEVAHSFGVTPTIGLVTLATLPPGSNITATAYVSALSSTKVSIIGLASVAPGGGSTATVYWLAIA
jgi:hypothetical protein